MTIRQRITDVVSEVFVQSIILLLYLCSPSFAIAQVHPRSTAGLSPAELTTIMRAIDSPDLKSAFVGVQIIDASTRSVLFSTNAHRMFEPASCCKLLTSAAAMSILGIRYRFETKLELANIVNRQSSKPADLILVGGGDPVLNTHDLTNLAQQLIGKISVIDRLEYYDRIFDRQRLGDGWAWDDEPYYYSPQISGLNCAENVITISITPGVIDGPPKLLESPVLPQVRVVNKIVTVKGRNHTDVRYNRVEGRNVIKLSGTISASAAGIEKVVIPLTFMHPGEMTAYLTISALRSLGIKVIHSRPNQVKKLPTATEVVAEHYSVPLSQMLVLMNKPSDNLIAECLLQAGGVAATGRSTAGYDGTGLTASRAALATFNVDLHQLHQVDGSGLSRQDLVSPANLVNLLEALRTHKHFRYFYQSLPIAGVDGPLAWRMKNTRAANNCHAKTGYLSGVSTIAGYVNGQDGTPFVFAIMINNHVCSEAACQLAQNTIIEMLANATTTRRSAP